MKRKLFYLLIIFCSTCFFSSAKQNKINCGKETVCCSGKQKAVSNKEWNTKSGKGFDLSPLQLLVFGI